MKGSDSENEVYFVLDSISAKCYQIYNIKDINSEPSLRLLGQGRRTLTEDSAADNKLLKLIGLTEEGKETNMYITRKDLHV